MKYYEIIDHVPSHRCIFKSDVAKLLSDLKKLSVFVSGPALPEFLLPFRKPKRIRTAFSPSQLLKLEQAFEKNQYVVGAERKELAKSLNLSETQVRRTFKP